MRTTDTGIVRSYCENNVGGVFDLNYLANNIFKDIPHVNLRKIVTRLIDSGLLRQVSKGVYMIGESELSDEERIIQHYTYDEDVRIGMASGNYLMYLLGLLDNEPRIKEIRSTRTVGNKLIGNVQIIESKSSIAEGGLHTYEIFVVMEILYRHDEIPSCYADKAFDIIQRNCRLYKDFILKYMEIEYPRTAYINLANTLDSMEISNRVMEYYVEKTTIHTV